MYVEVRARTHFYSLRKLFSRTAICVLVAWGHGLSAHGPSEVLMYPAGKVYDENGWEKPKLKAAEVARVGGDSLSIDTYKTWLFFKVGLHPDNYENYLKHRYMLSFLEAEEVNIDEWRAVYDKNAYRFFRYNAVFQTVEEWEQALDAHDWGLYELRESDQRNLSYFYEKNFISALFMIHAWPQFKDYVAKRGYAGNLLSLDSGDATADRVLTLNNAFFLYRAFENHMSGRLSEIAFENLDEHAYDEAKHREWVYTYYHSVYNLENLISMLLIEKEAEGRGIVAKESVIQELYDLRRSEYQRKVDQLNERLEAYDYEMPVHPGSLDSLLNETRVDLMGSRLFREEKPLQPYELKKRFYEAYGFEGQKVNVFEIFKWVKKPKANDEAAEAYEAYVRAETAKIEQALLTLREELDGAGADLFKEMAMIENEYVSEAQQYGRLNRISDVFDTDVVASLETMEGGQISSPIQSLRNSLHLIYCEQREAGERSYFSISKRLPTLRPFDHEAYQTKLKDTEKELLELKEVIVEGASFESIAAKASDSYKRFGYDISQDYQKRYGYRFSRELNQIPVGEFGIIPTARGLSLVYVHSKETTALDEAVKDALVDAYLTTLATNDELNELSELLLYKHNPYFESTF